MIMIVEHDVMIHKSDADAWQGCYERERNLSKTIVQIV